MASSKSGYYFSKFIRSTSYLLSSIPSADLNSKILALNYKHLYFSALQKDIDHLLSTVNLLQKELDETKTKMENGCGCFCKQ